MVKDAGLKKVVFHWFSGPIELIPSIAGEGYFMSASPALIYNPYHQKAIQAVPLSNLLLETDSPVTYRDLHSRPVHVQERVGKGVQRPDVGRVVARSAAPFPVGKIDGHGAQGSHGRFRAIPSVPVRNRT